MSVAKQIDKTTVRLEKGDITDFEVEAFVYYAQNDLKLGAGFGNAIAVRGGPSVQKQLDEIGSAQIGDVFMTDAGNMKAKHILHAVGPKFQEEDLETKLADTMKNTLNLAEDKGIKQIAFPAMGVGFYVVPLETCARIMLETIKEHIHNGSRLSNVIIMVLDNREYNPFAAEFEKLS